MAPEMSPEDIVSNENLLAQKTAALKGLRVEINTVLAHARDIADTLIQRGPGGRELSLSITNLQQGRQWAGEALGELGHKLPPEYRDDGNPVEEKWVQFDPHKQPWPDGIVSWDSVGYKPRDMSWGYIDTLSGRVHVMAGDWIVTDAGGHKRVEKRAKQ